MLCGDPSEVLSGGEDIVELIKEKEDHREQYGVRKHSIVEDHDIESLHLRGTKFMNNNHLL